MIMTLEDYYIKRYQGIEREFLDKTSAYLNENTEKILEYLVKNTTEILKKALNIQNERDIPCGYMSFSL